MKSVVSCLLPEIPLGLGEQLSVPLSGNPLALLQVGSGFTMPEAFLLLTCANEVITVFLIIKDSYANYKKNQKYRCKQNIM